MAETKRSRESLDYFDCIANATEIRNLFAPWSVCPNIYPSAPFTVSLPPTRGRSGCKCDLAGGQLQFYRTLAEGRSCVNICQRTGVHNFIQLPANWICILYPMEIGTICRGCLAWSGAGNLISENYIMTTHYFPPRV